MTTESIKFSDIESIKILFGPINGADLVGMSKKSNYLGFFFGRTLKSLITNVFPHERYVFQEDIINFL